MIRTKPRGPIQRFLAAAGAWTLLIAAVGGAGAARWDDAAAPGPDSVLGDSLLERARRKMSQVSPDAGRALDRRAAARDLQQGREAAMAGELDEALELSARAEKRSRDPELRRMAKELRSAIAAYRSSRARADGIWRPGAASPRAALRSYDNVVCAHELPGGGRVDEKGCAEAANKAHRKLSRGMTPLVIGLWLPLFTGLTGILILLFRKRSIASANFPPRLLARLVRGDVVAGAFAEAQRHFETHIRTYGSADEIDVETLFDLHYFQGQAERALEPIVKLAGETARQRKLLLYGLGRCLKEGMHPLGLEIFAGLYPKLAQLDEIPPDTLLELFDRCGKLEALSSLPLSPARRMTFARSLAVQHRKDDAKLFLERNVREALAAWGSPGDPRDVYGLLGQTRLLEDERRRAKELGLSLAVLVRERLWSLGLRNPRWGLEEGKVLYRTARDLGRLQALSVERLRGPALQEYLSQALAEQDLERSTAAFDAFAAEFDRKAAEIATHAADGGPDSSFAKAGLKRLIELGLRFAREMACFLLQKGLPRDAGIGLDRFREHWGPEEYALRFEAFLLEGQESLAGAIFDKLKGLHEAREEAKLFYELGAAAERHGFPGLALRAYGHMIVEGADFADVKERHRTLAGGPGKTPAPIGSRAWPGDRDTTLAAPAPAAGGKRYERLRVIGEGGMGVVYEARDTLLGRKVAIKELKSELKARRREVARFLEEARIVARLQHPNIVAIHEVVQDEGEAFMVLELVRGEPLGERLDAQRLDWGGFLLLAEQICAAVDYAHSQGIIHRDIKPSNILVAGKSAVKLTDFGIARGVKDALSQLTGTVVKGTLSYMAPEQHYGESDARSDVYALGVTFYEMLAGELPFRGPDPLPPKKEMRYQPPSALGRPLPEGADGRRLDRVFERCFQVDPARRFPTVAELFKALSQTTDAVDAQATDGARPWRPA